MNKCVIEAFGLCKTYFDGDQKIRALKSVDVQVSLGEMVAVTGPSGCGKSTLFHVLGLISAPDSGEILIEDHEVLQLKESRKAMLRNSYFGYVVQDFALLEKETVLYNVELPMLYSSPRISRGARRAKAEKWISALGIDDKKNTIVKRLSGGQRQRVAIARALVGDPAVVLADEPTGALDSRNSEEVFKILRGLTDENRSVIMATHNEEMARGCDRILLMKDGEIKEG